MSPGLRLLVAPGVLLAAALAVYALPARSERRPLAVAALATLVATGLLASTLPVVDGGGRVERSLGSLVEGVPLGVRGDSTGVVLGLAACAACLLCLLGPAARSLERSGILLCLAGSCTVCLGANVVLLYAGLGLGDVGALLMVTAATADPARLRRAKLVFAADAVTGLALLDSALRLRVGVGTSDLAAIPESYLGGDIATPWAVAGMARLAAAAALPIGEASRPSSAWLPVGALPSGLAVLLRLGSTEGPGGAPKATAAMLAAVGAGLAVGGAVVALRARSRPAAAGRALLVSGAGQVIAAFAAGSAAATTAAVAAALGLIVAAVSAPAWASAGAGRHSGTRALALLAAAGVPFGAGTAAVLTVAGAEAAAGPPRSVLAVAAGVGALLAGVAGALAARDTLRARPSGGREDEPLRRDVVAALAVAAVLTLTPGVVAGTLAERISSSAGQLLAVDAGALRGPGGGFAGGYLAIGAVLLGITLLSAAGVAGVRWRPAPGGASPGPVVARGATRPGRRLRSWWERPAAAVGRVDSWLVEQPDLPVVLLVSVLCLAWFTLRK